MLVPTHSGIHEAIFLCFCWELETAQPVHSPVENPISADVIMRVQHIDSSSPSPPPAPEYSIHLCKQSKAWSQIYIFSQTNCMGAGIAGIFGSVQTKMKSEFHENREDFSIDALMKVKSSHCTNKKADFQHITVQISETYTPLCTIPKPFHRSHI